MKQFEFTAHAENMILERNIAPGWVTTTISEPLFTETKNDGTIHYLKPIPEYGGRILRVVANPGSLPPRIITVFFDRRARRK